MSRDLNKTIKKIMIDKEINNSDLAMKMNRSQQYISNLLKQDNYSIDTLDRIAEALGCELVMEFREKE